jgi:hypothetical protein
MRKKFLFKQLNYSPSPELPESKNTIERHSHTVSADNFIRSKRNNNPKEKSWKTDSSRARAPSPSSLWEK